LYIITYCVQLVFLSSRGTGRWSSDGYLYFFQVEVLADGRQMVACIFHVEVLADGRKMVACIFQVDVLADGR